MGRLQKSGAIAPLCSPEPRSRAGWHQGRRFSTILLVLAMPKLGCLCGHVHNLSPIPDAGWITIRDVDYETVIELETSHAKGAARAELISLQGRMYECPECGRLMWC